VATADVCIGRNRRRADAAIDATTPVVRVDGEDGSALAVLYVHACHPTALGHDNLLFSADWPGAAARTIEDAIPGALAVFALGAHADVDPRTRGLLDLAVANQSVGVSFEEMEALGREVGEAVAEVASAIVTRADVEVAAAVRTIDASVHGGDLAEDAYDAWLAVRRGEALSALGLDPDENVRTADFYRLERDAIQGLPPDAVRERLGRVRSYLRDRTATRIAQGRRTGIELQLVRLGPLLLLGLPLEVTVDVGLAWRRRAPAEFTAIVSIANGWLRYLPDPRHFEEPEALHQYEILQSTFVPDTAERLLDAAEQLAGTV
jgi:hypothetical protein